VDTSSEPLPTRSRSDRTKARSTSSLVRRVNVPGKHAGVFVIVVAGIDPILHNPTVLPVKPGRTRRRSRRPAHPWACCRAARPRTTGHDLCLRLKSPGDDFSRDLIGEDGSDNLYSFADNDAVDFIDYLGLDALEYWSQGKTYYDANPVGVSRSHSESGIQSSPSAYYYQVVIETGYCPGGTCNSGGSGESSSFIRAKVKNTSKCPLTVDCECNVEWFVSNSTPGKRGRKGAIVKGHVLGDQFDKTYLPKPQPDGSWLAVGRGSFSQQKTFSLAPGAAFDLYHGYDQITSPPDTPGAGWTESMSGDCTCTARK